MKFFGNSWVPTVMWVAEKGVGSQSAEIALEELRFQAPAQVMYTYGGFQLSVLIKNKAIPLPITIP